MGTRDSLFISSVENRPCEARSHTWPARVRPSVSQTWGSQSTSTSPSSRGTLSSATQCNRSPTTPTPPAAVSARAPRHPPAQPVWRVARSLREETASLRECGRGVWVCQWTWLWGRDHARARTSVAPSSVAGASRKVAKQKAREVTCSVACASARQRRPTRIVFGRMLGSFHTCRSPQAALNCSYCSDRVTRY